MLRVVPVTPCMSCFLSPLCSEQEAMHCTRTPCSDNSQSGDNGMQRGYECETLHAGLVSAPIQESVGAVVNRQPQDAHVVSVEDTCEACNPQIPPQIARVRCSEQETGLDDVAAYHGRSRQTAMRPPAGAFDGPPQNKTPSTCSFSSLPPRFSALLTA